jgi:biotin carboxylase
MSVVIVDPFSSGRYLVQELADRGINLIAVISSDLLPDFWQKQLEQQFFEEVIQPQDIETTVNYLKTKDIIAVVPGSEPGVMCADELADALGLPCNGAETCEWRRNKYPMQERLREVGLRAIRQIYSRDLDEILAWSRSNYPVVIKPAMSAGTDGVYFCDNDDHVRSAYKENMSKLNVTGEANTDLLVQERLIGTEYVVDCVSHNGKHVVNGMWKYWSMELNHARVVFRRTCEMLPCRGEVQDQLVPYIFKCLDALDLKHGASHSEVFLTKDGPCLVETGARLHGLKGPKIAELATGLGQHELWADVILGGRLHEEMYKNNQQYVLKKFAFQTNLVNYNVEGTLASSLDCPALRDLESVWTVSAVVKPGESLVITRDLMSVPGFVYQVHADYDKCVKDITTIETLETRGLFDVSEKAIFKDIDASGISATSTIFADGDLSDSAESVSSYSIPTPTVSVLPPQVLA